VRRIVLAIGVTILLWPVATAAAERTVTMKGETYQPPSLAAKVGDTIRFSNDDTETHNVFVPTADHAFDLGKQEPGQTKAIRLGKPGRFEVECVIHGHMSMIVEVTR